MIYAGVEEQKERAQREGFGRGRRLEGRATLVAGWRGSKFGVARPSGRRAGGHHRPGSTTANVTSGSRESRAIARIGDPRITHRRMRDGVPEELLARARETLRARAPWRRSRIQELRHFETIARIPMDTKSFYWLSAEKPTDAASAL